MTEATEHDPEWARFVADLRAQLGPRDAVPRPPMSRETLLRLDRRAGTGVKMRWPGEPSHDVDGVPSGLPEPTTYDASWLPAAVTRAEVERAVLDVSDVPNLRVVDPPTNERTHDD